MMKSVKNVRDRSSAWITIAGIILALLICLLGTSMVMVVYPQSSSFFKLLAAQGEKLVSLDQSAYFQAAQPTPFQPGPTLTPNATPTPVPTPQPTAIPAAVDVTPVQIAAAALPEEPEQLEQDDSSVSIPMSSYVNGLVGTAQLYTLDCEAQAAVDWAGFFGVGIDELEFIDRLPKSDDPESGFVGNINGLMGHLPPDDYGVHASPIASLLREYGLPAKAKHDWDYAGIKKEIAAGQPVIVWIVNMPFEIAPREYTASNGNTTIVAPYEHTWIITGYNATTVTVVDSEWTYNVKITTFMERWEALGKQAVIYTGD
jgi:uncharacterized protein YvpB